MAVSFTTVLSLRGWSHWSVKLSLLHYFLNLAWAPIFFGLKKFRLGLFINFFLLSSLAGVIVSFSQVSLPASLLLLPYFCWLSFATVLNNGVLKRNPSANGYSNANLQADLYMLGEVAARAGRGELEPWRGGEEGSTGRTREAVVRAVEVLGKYLEEEKGRAV